MNDREDAFDGAHRRSLTVITPANDSNLSSSKDAVITSPIQHEGDSSDSQWLSSALTAEVLYCTVSAGTILFNKHALSTFHFPAPNTLLLFQFGMAVVLLQLLHLLGLINVEPLRWKSVRLWAPLNLIFVAMNVTAFFSLQLVGAGMFTILKNLSNVLTIGGDWYLYGLSYSWQVWFCLLLMTLSAFVGGATDLHFNLRGYAWQVANCFFTAAYSLYLSAVIKKASAQQHDKKQLNELSMVYYNNVLSLPPLILLILLSGELRTLQFYPHFHTLEFQVVAVLGGLMGFLVSFASIWCMSRTSATLYSLTGSLNKVLVAAVGMWLFKEPTNVTNLVSIIMGLGAGLLFVFAKTKPISAPISKSGETDQQVSQAAHLLETASTKPSGASGTPSRGMGKVHANSGSVVPQDSRYP
ncbi:hypothetical protein CEUSTIGMA_g5742.t1 [Chlamydomonas eustigma]|uniref:Sugar phosphate transporter domain-containing protein n=1 Tax=Chlamydomonas eustigma TaxID=1157962 RepID=A0A250X6A1_9CHLO|nr:hypothetical protein CEUSTIGMA_g5742.t1 [Chlamydomonas eustigma]|eukprot:GAX78300.1 hypothetical protein CEUSTIGMA_g5742.t1 [Chlamydomonas eustigma]